jgi:hypothetical protein
MLGFDRITFDPHVMGSRAEQSARLCENPLLKGDIGSGKCPPSLNRFLPQRTTYAEDWQAYAKVGSMF